MQDSSDQETILNTTRAGGPDDTRALETSEKEEDEENEVTTEETDAMAITVTPTVVHPIAIAI